MPSLRSSGKIVGSSVSIKQLAREHNLSSPISLREMLPVLGVRGDPEIAFQFGTHNLSFENFSDGVPDLGTFKDTFGEAEVLHELIDPFFGHPVLTTAFFLFYRHFLFGTANGGLATGFCTSLASLVADRFWTGRTDTPTITKASVHKFLTAVHGKLLSRESLLHFHDQGREGAARIEQTCREVEAAFLRGPSRQTAPLIFFIPAGEVWDGGYFDRLGNSHCVMPYRFAYPPGHPGPQLSSDGRTTVTNLDNVELFVWDCNHPTDPRCKLVFRDRGGLIEFDYPRNPALNSQNGITLGIMTNGDYLLADHDLPFSGPLGLGRFIIDFLLSPADLEITDPNGRRTGSFAGKIRAEIPGSHPCYLVPGAYLLPDDVSLTRRITGTATGRYTFNSIMPAGGSIVLQGVTTAAGQVDVLSMNPDQTQVRFRPGVEKIFDVTIGRRVDDQARAITIQGIGSGPAAEVEVNSSQELLFAHISNPGRARNVKVQAVVVDRNNKPLEKQLATANLAPSSEIRIDVRNWDTLDATVR